MCIIFHKYGHFIKQPHKLSIYFIYRDLHPAYRQQIVIRREFAGFYNKHPAQEINNTMLIFHLAAAFYKAYHVSGKHSTGTCCRQSVSSRFRPEYKVWWCFYLLILISQ
jgi:hypothetical protein